MVPLVGFELTTYRLQGDKLKTRIAASLDFTEFFISGDILSERRYVIPYSPLFMVTPFLLSDFRP